MAWRDGMTNRIECPKCGDLELHSVNTYREGETLWTEYVCERCGHYEQHARIDHDYDPSPDDQESVTRIGGWG